MKQTIKKIMIALGSSRTVRLAAIQLLVAVVLILEQHASGGFVLILKSIVDIALRMNTKNPVILE